MSWNCFGTARSYISSLNLSESDRKKNSEADNELLLRKKWYSFSWWRNKYCLGLRTGRRKFSWPKKKWMTAGFDWWRWSFWKRRCSGKNLTVVPE